jgi:hypothetical protein
LACSDEHRRCYTLRGRETIRILPRDRKPILPDRFQFLTAHTLNGVIDRFEVLCKGQEKILLRSAFASAQSQRITVNSAVAQTTFVWNCSTKTDTIGRERSNFDKELWQKKECGAMGSSIKPFGFGVLLTGLAIGLLIGMMFAPNWPIWPNVPMHAVATDRSDGFAVATGYCDDSVEAVYFLDFLTGELTAAVVSKQTGRFNAFYTHNVAADLGVSPSRPPRFVLTTGTADLRRTGGKITALSKSLVYVSELYSGKVAAYAIPWSSSAWNAGQTLRGEFTLLDVGRFRAAGAAVGGKSGE